MSTAAIPVHVALVDETKKVRNLPAIAASLNEQIQADFAPVWKVAATVGAYTPAAVPAACWAVRVQAQLDQPGALGYHTDDGNQPYALVELTADVSTTIGHEVLEMLADPWGNRTHSARLPAGVEGQYRDFGVKTRASYVRYLLEVCDPPEATSYPVGGVELSDFLLPGWYRSTPSPLPSYSHAGACRSPREVADGGYVSFSNPGGEWYQVFNQGGQLQVQDIGKFRKADHGSLREFTDAKAREHRAAAA